MPSTPSPPKVEHYVTLFDSAFLPCGLALHASLARHARSFRLWILCMDIAVEEQLTRLALPSVSLIPLRELETPELLAVKPTRSRGEYCWTVTPFTFDAVFARDPSAARVTYLDADLFFFRDPAVLLDEFDRSSKDVLITEHAYSPEYDLTHKVGRFCVQFLTVRDTDGARVVTAWWKARCLEWCFARHEDGKFGDQKYLDQWPRLFSAHVHILEQVHETLGPWNVRRLLPGSRALPPVLYHFHGLRLTGRSRMVLYNGYRIGPGGESLYRQYVSTLSSIVTMLDGRGITFPRLPQRSLRDRLKRYKNRLLGRYAAVSLA
jgi:hypothetical protein